MIFGQTKVVSESASSGREPANRRWCIIRGIKRSLERDESGGVQERGRIAVRYGTKHSEINKLFAPQISFISLLDFVLSLKDRGVV